MTISLEEHVARLDAKDVRNAMPMYGEIPWELLIAAVSEAHGCPWSKKHPEGSIGHEMVGSNMNSLNRVVSAFLRAAIAAVREREGVERKPPGLTDEQAICAAHVVVETVKAKLNLLPKAKPMPYHDPAPDPAEAMLAEIEWLKSAGRKQGQQIADSVEIEIIERVEAMRAKLKLATDFLEDVQDGLRINGWGKELGELFAALKGNGE
jgi:hypothetical protein